MSCLGPDYNPVPPREWARYENLCAYYGTNIVGLNGLTYNLSQLKKGNVLQYKKNSSNLTKNQIYSKIATGMWTNRTTTWASQSDIYTNPNTTSLKRVGYININISGPFPVPTTAPLTCNLPIIPPNNVLPINNSGTQPNPNPPPIIPPPPPSDKGSNTIIPNIVGPSEPEQIVIPDGGNMVCNIKENICTGEIYEVTRNQQCFPTSDSDVPGPIQSLCYNDALPTYYPRTKITYGTSGNKWPQGSKFIKSAVNTNTKSNIIL